MDIDLEPNKSWTHKALCFMLKRVVSSLRELKSGWLAGDEILHLNSAVAPCAQLLLLLSS